MKMEGKEEQVQEDSSMKASESSILDSEEEGEEESKTNQAAGSAQAQTQNMFNDLKIMKLGASSKNSNSRTKVPTKQEQTRSEKKQEKAIMQKLK